MTPTFETAEIIGSQIPMLCALFGSGLFIRVSILNASIRISIKLFNKLNRGPSGNATVNRVIKPNWITLKTKYYKYIWNKSLIRFVIPISKYSSKRLNVFQLLRSKSLAY